MGTRLFVAGRRPDFRIPALDAAPRKNEGLSEINLYMILVEIVRLHHGVAEDLPWYMHKMIMTHNYALHFSYFRTRRPFAPLLQSNKTPQ